MSRCRAAPIKTPQASPWIPRTGARKRTPMMIPTWYMAGARGVLIGAALHLLMQVRSLVRLKGQYYPQLGLSNPDVREVGRLMVPRLLGVAAVQLNFWVNTRLASQQPEGSVTGIVFAFALMLMPQAAIAQSIAIAAMPTFSAQAALGHLSEMRSSLAQSLRGVLLLAFPAAFGLMLLRTPLTALLYQRGEFDQRSTELVAWALLWYAAGLVGHSVVEIVSRAFYALHDTRTPVLLGVAAMALNTVLSYLLAGLFTQVGWLPHGGLALANSLATTLEMLALLYVIRRRLDGLGSRRVLVAGSQALLAALLMSLAIWGWMSFSREMANWIVVTGGIAVGIVVYGLAAWALGVKEVRALPGMLRRVA